MAKEVKKYNIPTEAGMVKESLATYTSLPAQDHIVLTIPQGIDAEAVREKVNTYFNTLLNECMVEQEFRTNLDKWLYCTGIYSGPNLCWDNEPFKRLESMGQIVLPMIDKVRNNYPDYTQRHIEWLRRKFES